MIGKTTNKFLGKRKIIRRGIMMGEDISYVPLIDLLFFISIVLEIS